jgi:hypothetical protein
VDTLVTALRTSHITVTSACAVANCEGWITVADAIRWDSGNTLSLHATGRIFINADIDGRGAANTAGGGVVVRSGVLADGQTSSGLASRIQIHDASIRTGGGVRSSDGAGLGGGNVMLQAHAGAVVFSGSGTVDTSGGAAQGSGNHSGGNAGAITVLAGVDDAGLGIDLRDHHLVAQRGSSVGTGAQAQQGALTLAATGKVIQNAGSLVGHSLAVTAANGEVASATTTVRSPSRWVRLPGPS